MKEAFELNRRDWIAGLQHGLAIIEAFDEANPRMTPAQVAERTGLTRTAARRHLLTLRALGYLDTNDKAFWLMPRVLRLGASYFESGRVPRLVQPFLQRLTTSTDCAAYFSVNDADEVIYVARNGLNPTLNTGFVLGSRLPMTVTSAGFALLATYSDEALGAFMDRYRPRAFTSQTIVSKERLLEEVMRARSQGYALMEQQLQVGMRGIAIVVRDQDDVVAGALSLTMSISTRSAAQEVKRVLPQMQETAQTLRGML